MNLVPGHLFFWIKPLIERLTAFGVRSVVQENVALFATDIMKANQSASVVAVDGIDYAEKLGASGVPAKRKIGELLEQGTMATMTLLTEVTSGQMSLSEGREALAENPFMPSSAGSLPTSGPAPADTVELGPKAIESRPETANGRPSAPELPSESTPPPRPKRGRPRKNPSP